MENLPEDCVANVVCLTSPADACRLAVVSSTIKSAAASDGVWERLLPSDYLSIISNSSDPSLLTRFSSKKQLYLCLSCSPILIHDSTQSFQLDKWTGKKLYMLSARALDIALGDNPTYWRWNSDTNSRFSEAAELVTVSGIEINGRINTSMLSPATAYAAYLVFKLHTEWYGFYFDPVEITTGIVGSQSCMKAAHLSVKNGMSAVRVRRRGVGVFSRFMGSQEAVHHETSNAEYSQERGDGWLEVELGDFYSEEGKGEEFEMTVCGQWMRGLIIEGIEIRPKKCLNSL